MTASIADRLFDAQHAESDLAALLGEEVIYERMGWDHYDRSLELHGVPVGYRLSAKDQRIIQDAGFSIVYVNHTDKWETHYDFTKFPAPVKGWRVSYPGKRPTPEGGIWVEETVPTWPKEWFDNGRAVVKETDMIGFGR